MSFDHDPIAPRQARQAVKRLLIDPDDPIAFNVETVTSELVSNVVQHTADGGTVRAWDPKPDVPFRLEVSDTSTDLRFAPKQPTEPGGHGLSIVDTLSEAWGVEPMSQGKTVWAEFNRDEAEDTDV